MKQNQDVPADDPLLDPGTQHPPDRERLVQLRLAWVQAFQKILENIIRKLRMVLSIRGTSAQTADIRQKIIHNITALLIALGIIAAPFSPQIKGFNLSCALHYPPDNDGKKRFVGCNYGGYGWGWGSGYRLRRL